MPLGEDVGGDQEVVTAAPVLEVGIHGERGHVLQAQDGREQAKGQRRERRERARERCAGARPVTARGREGDGVVHRVRGGRGSGIGSGEGAGAQEEGGAHDAEDKVRIDALVKVQ